MASLDARLKRVEKALKKLATRPDTNRTVTFDPEATTADATLAALNVGKKSGKPVLLVASWRSDDAWRDALRAQQRQLIASNVARPHTTKKAPADALAETLAPGASKRRALPVDERPEGGLKVLYRN